VLLRPALARKLLIALWRMTTGEIPEGAVLRPDKEKEFNGFRESTAEVLSATNQNPRWW
jgi:hypothetical protein